MIYLTSSFSLQMIKRYPLRAIIEEITKDQFIEGLRFGFYGAIGHEPTASMMTNDLGMFIKYNRDRVTVIEGDQLYVWQYSGGRLPEGARVLPVGGEIRYLRVDFY